MDHRTFPARVELKAAEQPGTFEAIVAVFGNTDGIGDRLVKGCFTRTLQERGMPPIVWDHEWGTPPIGQSLDARETDEGLYVKARLFLDDHEIARQVYAGLRDGALHEFSFGYKAVAVRWIDENGVEVRELLDVDLFECGPTLVGMNPATRLVGVKRQGAVPPRLARLLTLKPR